MGMGQIKSMIVWFFLKILPKAKYGGRHTVTMLPGGGIGPELMGYVKEVFRYAGVPVDFEEVNISPSSDSNEELEYAITSIRRNGVAIKGMPNKT